MTASQEEQVESWRAAVSSAFYGLCPEPWNGAATLGDVQHVSLGSLGAFTVHGTPQVLRRPSRAVRGAPSDELKMCLLTRGSAIVQQGDREVPLTAGRLAVYDLGRPYALRFDEDWSCFVITFPRNGVALTRRELLRTMGHSHDARTGTVAMVSDFVETALTRAVEGSSESTKHLGEAGLHLLSAAFNTEPPAAEPPEDVVRARIERYVRQHLSNPDLSTESVAAAHHMSLRTVQRLFSGQERTLSQLIRHERLEGARRDLANPRLAKHTIAGLAARWGFVNAPGFTRAFRAAYNMSPSEAREAGPSDHPREPAR
ncbi:helix-turn-helix domain-containing protein [Actinopolyspora halophila]|uniref:AraC-like ligand-binding domain-containing protein n=1 Tax=Actinopolyspora halophila TaxID=1850 RepID=UPI000368F2BE|nr:helix-turn-helix domain-containing protein [Actinopolyspora halophila]